MRPIDWVIVAGVIALILLGLTCGCNARPAVVVMPDACRSPEWPNAYGIAAVWGREPLPAEPWPMGVRP